LALNFPAKSSPHTCHKWSGLAWPGNEASLSHEDFGTFQVLKTSEDTPFIWMKKMPDSKKRRR